MTATDLVVREGRQQLAGTSMIARGAGSALQPANLGEVVQFADLMSRSQHAVPKHLRENAGACFAVCMRAFSLEMEPFAFASKTYFVNDAMAFEAQLVAAIVITRAPIKERPDYVYEGEGPTRKCTVTVQLLSGSMRSYMTPMNKDIKVKNSPLWTGDLDQQLGYFGVRGLGRRHFPETLMGIYTPEERQAGMGDGEGVASSFEDLEARAVVETTAVEVKPEPTPKPKAAAKAKPAATAPEQPPPQEPAAVLAAAPASATSASATDASKASAPTAEDSSQAASQQPLTGGSQDDSLQTEDTPREASNRDLSAEDKSSQSGGPQANQTQPAQDAGEPADPEASTPEKPTGDTSSVGGAPIDGFADYAGAVAEANDWPTINQAHTDLRETPAWAAAEKDMRNASWRIAFVRLHELVQGGYTFDFLTDMYAWRAYIEWETDPATAKYNRAIISKGPEFMALSTPAKIAMDAAFEARMTSLAGAGAFS